MPYIALDIESTGFDTSLDHVIEIAAIKFEGEKIIDRFETLLNPGIKIPPIISHITGIKDEDVADAPVFATIEQQLTEFLGNHPIVGHNIDFDVNFLKAKGLKLINPLFDTLQLSTILLPGLPSYSLDTLGRLLKLDHHNKHRAMADTIACHKLFMILEEKIREINPETAQTIQELVQRSTWELKELFMGQGSSVQKKKSVSRMKEQEVWQRPFGGRGLPRVVEDELPVLSIPAIDYDETALLNELDEDGKLKQILGHYEPRGNQKKMAATILECLKKDEKIIIEAGTGIGKTMAYLMATLYWSLKHNAKIVISTHTHNLQEQILKKDVPILEKLFAPTQSEANAPAQQAGFAKQNTKPFETALIKGRSNYLSKRRLEIFMDQESFEDSEISGLIKVLLWVGKTETGDLEELTFINKEQNIVDEICCSEYVCPHTDPVFKNNCFLAKARQKAMTANLIIVNHALLLQDCFGDSPILPEYQYLIIDEAHQLEQVATDSLSMHLSLFQFHKPFELLKKHLNHILHTPTSLFENSFNLQELAEIKEKVENILNRIEIFFGLVGIFYEKNLRVEDNAYEVNLQKSDLGSMEWFQVRESGQSILALGSAILVALQKATGGIEKSTEENSKKGVDPAAQKKELAAYGFECQKKIMELGAILKNQDQPDDHVTWIYKNAQQNVGMKQSRLNVSEPLNTRLFSKKQSIVLTSATLRTDHSFNFIRSQLGLGPEFKELELPSHFTYPEQVKILIPEDLPEPMTEGYFLSCCHLIANIIKKNQGRTLVLFTAKKALAATYHKIAPQLKQEGFTVLAQNMTGGRGKIIEHFKDEPEKCAIFGTNSFWEGVDLQGKQLNCVIIQKLPFDPPSDPIIAARSKKFMDPFNEYQLPRAILRFKQGFGRLIRSSQDTGSIVILDNRVVQKSYGRSFLESLPEGIKIEYGTKNNLQELL